MKITKSHQISPKQATKNAIRSRKVADQAESGVEWQKSTQKKKTKEIKEEEDLAGELRKGGIFVVKVGRGGGGVWALGPLFPSLEMLSLSLSPATMACRELLCSPQTNNTFITFFSALIFNFFYFIF